MQLAATDTSPKGTATTLSKISSVSSTRTHAVCLQVPVNPRKVVSCPPAADMLTRQPGRRTPTPVSTAQAAHAASRDLSASADSGFSHNGSLKTRPAVRRASVRVHAISSVHKGAASIAARVLAQPSAAANRHSPTPTGTRPAPRNASSDTTTDSGFDHFLLPRPSATAWGTCSASIIVCIMMRTRVSGIRRRVPPTPTAAGRASSAPTSLKGDTADSTSSGIMVGSHSLRMPAARRWQRGNWMRVAITRRAAST